MQGFDVLFLIAILIMSVVIHEVSHGVMADKLGDTTARNLGRLSLNPIRHIDPIGSILLPGLLILSGSNLLFGWAKPVPYNPYNLSDKQWGEAKVAFAGPASNIIIAAVFGLLMQFSGVLGLPQEFMMIFGTIVSLNIVLALFNMIPIPPLDGSKVLFAFLPYSLDYVREFLERYWIPLLVVFMLFFWQFFIPVVFFLFTLITGHIPTCDVILCLG